MQLKTKVLSGMAAVTAVTIAIGAWQLNAVRPAPSQLYQSWLATAPSDAERGAALLAFGNFGALDLDTLETAAFPWAIVATSLAFRAAGDDPAKVDMNAVTAAFK